MVDNWGKLQEVGNYGKPLSYAFTMPYENLYLTSIEPIHFVLTIADRKALETISDPITIREQLTQDIDYSAENITRQMAGVFWTSNIDKTMWCAMNANNLENPLYL
jgi:hypothetical protein